MSDHPTIGASQISALLGIHPWMTHHDVWKQMVHGIKQEDNEAMEQGREWEPDIINIYARRSAQMVLPNTITKTKNWLHATPDGLGYEPGFWKSPPPAVTEEAISYSIRGMDAKKSNDKKWAVLPSYYALQGQAQMYCWPNLEVVDFAALFPFHEFGIYPVAPDPDLQGQLNDTAEKFIKDYVLPKKLPPVDASESCRQAIIAQWPKEESDEFLAPSREVLAALGKLKELEPEAGMLQALIDENKNILRAFIGEKAGIQFEQGYASFKRNKSSKKTDWEGAFKAFLLQAKEPYTGIDKPLQIAREIIIQHLERLVKEHTKEVPGPRVLRIQWKKEAE